MMCAVRPQTDGMRRWLAARDTFAAIIPPSARIVRFEPDLGGFEIFHAGRRRQGEIVAPVVLVDHLVKELFAMPLGQRIFGRCHQIAKRALRIGFGPVSDPHTARKGAAKISASTLIVSEVVPGKERCISALGVLPGIGIVGGVVERVKLRFRQSCRRSFDSRRVSGGRFASGHDEKCGQRNGSDFHVLLSPEITPAKFATRAASSASLLPGDSDV